MNLKLNNLESIFVTPGKFSKKFLQIFCKWNICKKERQSRIIETA